MNKMQANALRIAELMGTFMYNKFARLGQLMSERRGEKIRCIEYYSSYNGLMPIVFESNNTDYEIHLYSSGVQLNTDEILVFDYYTEPEFIEALQLACIKYLELRNAN